MKPINYLHFQMELEGIETGKGNLITRSSPDVEEIPLVLLACTSDEQKITYFDSSLPLALRNELTTNDVQLFKIESAIELFNSFGISSKPGRSKTYTFPDGFASVDFVNVKCFRQDNPKVAAFGFSGLADKVYAIEREGKIISACVSSRQNSKSAEAWVFTHPNHRRKGLAQQVITAWASNLQSERIIPFYSHVVENINSANLASKMGLIHLFDESVLEKVA